MSVYQFPGVTSGKVPESHRKKETLEVMVWIINDWRKLPKVLTDALLLSSLTQDWVFLYKKRSSSTWVIGPELAQRNPTAYVVHRVPNFDGPQHKTKTKFALLGFFHKLLESTHKHSRYRVFPLKNLIMANSAKSRQVGKLSCRWCRSHITPF